MASAVMSPPISPLRERDSRPRPPSALSHISNRSRRSSGSGTKIDMTETSQEKKRLHTKADPSKALNEAQPSAVALEESNLEDLRLIQHKDNDGNVITDPDRSNPTRHRLERPLDTIRSFQAAAEGTSSSRRSTYSGSRPVSTIGFDGGNTRRSSYYSNQGYSPSPQRGRPGIGGYYRNSSYGFRPDSVVEESPGPSHQYYQQRNHTRFSSTPTYYQQAAETPSPVHSQPHSYETMTSGSDENNKSTNPSSQNSSFDHLHQIQQMRKPEEYPQQITSEYDAEFAPVSAPRPFAPLHNDVQNQNRQYGYQNDTQPQNGGSGYVQQQPRVPPSSYNTANNPRVPIRLNGSTGGGNDDYASGTGKRQSWLKRTFSKRDK